MFFGSMTKQFGNLKTIELKIEINTYSHFMNITEAK